MSDILIATQLTEPGTWRQSRSFTRSDTGCATSSARRRPRPCRQLLTVIEALNQPARRRLDLVLLISPYTHLTRTEPAGLGSGHGRGDRADHAGSDTAATSFVVPGWAFGYRSDNLRSGRPQAGDLRVPAHPLGDQRSDLQGPQPKPASAPGRVKFKCAVRCRAAVLAARRAQRAAETQKSNYLPSTSTKPLRTSSSLPYSSPRPSEHVMTVRRSSNPSPSGPNPRLAGHRRTQ